jgi:stage III sporulation protein AB
LLKVLGICLTMTACGGIGLIWARTYEKRPLHLSALIAALQLLETEILYGATPMPEAMEQVGSKCDDEVKELFLNTSVQLKNMEGLTAAEAWERAMEKTLPDTYFNSEDIKILKRFGASLGVSDRQDQAKHLELTRSQLKLALKQAEAAAGKHASVIKYMGFLSGLMLVLILY